MMSAWPRWSFSAGCLWCVACGGSVAAQTSTDGGDSADAFEASIDLFDASLPVPPPTPPIDAPYDGVTTIAPDGGPYSAQAPATCSAPPGPRHVFASVAAVMTTIDGYWFACNSALVIALADSAGPSDGIEFAATGTFVVLGGSADGVLVPYLPFGGDGSTTPIVVKGTWSVADASASRGANAYDLIVNAPTGAVYTEQIVLHDNPQVLGLIAGVVAPDQLVRPM
jgi:hypothetical protein